MVEVVRTNFAPIFSDFENFPAHLAKRHLTTIFKSVLCAERDFLPPKNDANHVKIGLEKKTLHLVEVIHYVTDNVELRKRDTKRRTLCLLTPTCVVRFPPNFARW